MKVMEISNGHYSHQDRTPRGPVGNAAFTLIELLCVIAVFVVLAASLLPVFLRAREKSRRATCQSQLKHLGLALLQYADDNDGQLHEPATGAAFGRAFFPDEVDSRQLIWHGYLQPYLKANLAICPSAPQPLSASFSKTHFTGATFARVDRKQLSVGMSAYLAPWRSWQCALDTEAGIPHTNSACVNFHRLSAYAFPGKTAAFADSVPRLPGESGGGYWVDPMATVDGDYGFATRHNGGVNVGFIDGHAKWYHAQYLIVPDQTDEQRGTGQCVNYDRAHVYYDPTAPLPDEQFLCEGRALR